MRTGGGETAAIKNTPEAQAASSTNAAQNAAAATIATAETKQTDGMTMTVPLHAITEEGTAIGRVAMVEGSLGDQMTAGDHIKVGVTGMGIGDIAISPASAVKMANSQAAGSMGGAEIHSAGSGMAGGIIAADISEASRECGEGVDLVGVQAPDQEWDSCAEAGLPSARFSLPMRTTTTK